MSQAAQTAVLSILAVAWSPIQGVIPRDRMA